MSSRQKGGRSRRKVERLFRKWGYLVANVEKSGKFVVEKDLFALSQGEDYADKGFDSLALGNGNIVFIQACSNTPKAQAFYRDFAKKYADGYIEVVVATVEDYYGIKLQWYEPDGGITEVYVPKEEIPSKSA